MAAEKKAEADALREEAAAKEAAAEEAREEAAKKEAEAKAARDEANEKQEETDKAREVEKAKEAEAQAARDEVAAKEAEVNKAEDLAAGQDERKASELAAAKAEEEAAREIATAKETEARQAKELAEAKDADAKEARDIAEAKDTHAQKTRQEAETRQAEAKAVSDLADRDQQVELDQADKTQTTTDADVKNDIANQDIDPKSTQVESETLVVQSGDINADNAGGVPNAPQGNSPTGHEDALASQQTGGQEQTLDENNSAEGLDQQTPNNAQSGPAETPSSKADISAVQPPSSDTAERAALAEAGVQNPVAGAVDQPSVWSTLSESGSEQENSADRPAEVEKQSFEPNDLEGPPTSASERHAWAQAMMGTEGENSTEQEAQAREQENAQFEVEQAKLADNAIMYRDLATKFESAGDLDGAALSNQLSDNAADDFEMLSAEWTDRYGAETGLDVGSDLVNTTTAPSDTEAVPSKSPTLIQRKTSMRGLKRKAKKGFDQLKRQTETPKRRKRSKSEYMKAFRKLWPRSLAPLPASTVFESVRRWQLSSHA